MKRSLLLVALAAGCHERTAAPLEVAPAPLPPVCAVASALRVAPTSSSSSSSLALARLGARRVALLADEDDATLRLIDLDTHTVTASAPLGAGPAHVIVDRRGRVQVSLPDLDRVVELTVTAAGALEECGRLETPPEPRALALFEDTLLVTSRDALTLFGTTKKTIALSSDPAGILVTGSTALVAHRTGSLVSVVALDRKSVAREISLAWRDRVLLGSTPVGDMPRFAVQAHALARVGERVMIPMVLAYPGDPHLEVTTTTAYGAASVHGIDAYFPHEAAVASLHPTGAKRRIRVDHETVDEGAQRVSRGRMAPAQPPCLLPRSAAVHGEDLVVACLGLDRLLVHRGDSELGRTERLRIEVPSGPIAVAVDGDDAVVWSQFARVLSVVSLVNDSRDVIPIARDRARDVAWLEGRKTFHTPVAFDGRACASCHPDGGDDGLVWATPHGLLQPPALAGRLDTAPFGWLGAAPSLEAHIGETMKRLMAKPMPAATMDSLVLYLRSLERERERRPLDVLAKKGRALFVSTEVGCASCHYDDGRGADGLKHDVGTGGAFDTPALTSIGASGPYMHDGRYASLRQVVALETMGTTKHLSDDDVTALVAYLKTL